MRPGKGLMRDGSDMQVARGHGTDCYLRVPHQVLRGRQIQVPVPCFGGNQPMQRILAALSVTVVTPETRRSTVLMTCRSTDSGNLPG